MLRQVSRGFVIASKLLDSDDKEALLPPETNEKVFNSYKSHIDYDIQNLVVQSGTNIVMILKIISKNNIDRIINNIKEDVSKFQNISVFFGVGDWYR